MQRGRISLDGVNSERMNFSRVKSYRSEGYQNGRMGIVFSIWAILVVGFDSIRIVSDRGLLKIERSFEMVSSGRGMQNSKPT